LTTLVPGHQRLQPLTGTIRPIRPGEPGNPQKPAREIVVDMTEMDYSPAVIEVKRGEQIHLVIRNRGTEAR
jgi:hypothetical protein